MRRYVLFALAGVMTAYTGCGTSGWLSGGPDPTPVATGNPAAMREGWAVKRDGPGLPNFYQVSPTLYRGGKPSEEGFGRLRALGVTTIIDLGCRFWETDTYRHPTLRYYNIPFYTWTARDDQVVAFLRLASGEGPVFVHCRRGADRTGFMVACYRVAVQGWSRESAIAEMTEGGFGFDRQYDNLVAYLRRRDFDDLRRQAGIRKIGAVDPVILTIPILYDESFAMALPCPSWASGAVDPAVGGGVHADAPAAGEGA